MPQARHDPSKAHLLQSETELRIQDKRTFPPRDVICVVAAVNPIPEPDKLFAVTVWEV